MDKELQLLGEMIISQKDAIAMEVHTDRMAGVPMTEEESNEFQKFVPSLLKTRADFIQLFGRALIDVNPKKTDEAILKWGKENGESFFKLGVPLDEALKDASFYRTYIWKAVEKEALANDVSLPTVFRAISIIDPLLDKAAYYFSLAYVEYHQKTLENAKSAFIELSVPVIPLTKGVGVLPLIGNIDTERAQLLMEETLSNSSKLNLNHLIFDLSGVLIVDTMVAQQLFQVFDALKLTGVETILTGIRPEVAQTMVSLGLALQGITIKSNLEQALKFIG
ncbi:STAS domain-containing protein [Heyndrickxia acidicola]|uniref:STAS domain-containing protein n=1 Tax=Heyndrickxia acidicola TaxID=209389 RepID=A0ABU6MNP8_9BACI|nr:STAS domain-containing protein [Heyndrickxia acidicola]MED1204660.1 STAS domain-containing protein [Heyndrickxia acidicola]